VGSFQAQAASQSSRAGRSLPVPAASRPATAMPAGSMLNVRATTDEMPPPPTSPAAAVASQKAAAAKKKAAKVVAAATAAAAVVVEEEQVVRPSRHCSTRHRMPFD